MDKKRKARTDRNHVIYALRGPEDALYVGLTVCAGKSPKKAVEQRYVKHVGRALLQTKDWKLCTAIRTHGAEAFTRDVLEVVRGKAMAHQRERELTKTLNANLNTA